MGKNIYGLNPFALPSIQNCYAISLPPLLKLGRRLTSGRLSLLAGMNLCLCVLALLISPLYAFDTELASLSENLKTLAEAVGEVASDDSGNTIDSDIPNAPPLDGSPSPSPSSGSSSSSSLNPSLIASSSSSHSSFSSSSSSSFYGPSKSGTKKKKWAKLTTTEKRDLLMRGKAYIESEAGYLLSDLSKEEQSLVHVGGASDFIAEETAQWEQWYFGTSPFGGFKTQVESVEKVLKNNSATVEALKHADTQIAWFFYNTQRFFDITSIYQGLVQEPNFLQTHKKDMNKNMIQYFLDCRGDLCTPKSPGAEDELFVREKANLKLVRKATSLYSTLTTKLKDVEKESKQFVALREANMKKLKDDLAKIRAFVADDPPLEDEEEVNDFD